MKKHSKKSNYEIIKDKKRFKIFHKNVYSRLIINFLFIAIQIFLLAFFIFRLEKYLEVYFGISLALTAGFMIFIVNKKGRNEFKLAWIVPMIFVPLFSIAAYLMYHTNRGSHRHSKRLALLREQTEILLPANIPSSLREQKELIREFSKNPSADLIYYLTNNFFFPYKNCNTTYYPNGETFFPALIEEIKNAQKFIFLEFFIIDVDSSWNEILSALQERQKNGVEIRILCDGLGSPVASTSFYQKYLKSKGFDSRVFLPIIPIVSTHLNNRDHRKIVIIDGKTSFTGGLNLANEYFNRGKNRFPYWKDNAVKIQGTAVHTFMQLFLQNWNLYSKTPEDFSPYLPALSAQLDLDPQQSPSASQDFNSQQIPGTQQELAPKQALPAHPGITIPYGDDFFNNKDIAENIYFYIINNAKKYLNITTPYILIDNLLQEALFFAAVRGVEVSIIVPSVPDHLLTFCIGKTYLESFVDNGIKVYLYNKGFIHSKMFIADDHIATIGSVNLDYRSLYHHFENGVVFLDSPVVHDAKADFDETLKDCTHMQKGDYKKIPLYQRALGRLFRIFAPLF